MISILALIVAVGGSTFAFAALNNKKVRRISSNTANRLITKRAANLKVMYAREARSAEEANIATSAKTSGAATTAGNADRLGELPSSAYARSTAIRSVTVSGGGTVDAAHSDGVGQANVSHPATGVYCIVGLDPAPKTAVAQIAFGSDPGATAYVRTSPPEGQFCEDKQVGIVTVNEAGDEADEPFEMIIH
jgi:hypothetical protein